MFKVGDRVVDPQDGARGTITECHGTSHDPTDIVAWNVEEDNGGQWTAFEGELVSEADWEARE